MDFWARIDREKGIVTVTPGIDFGNGSKPIKVWAESRFSDERYIVLKVPSGTHWASITQGTVSHPGQYIFGRIDNVAESGLEHIIILLECAVSERGRKGS